jgi:hypothetical protein
VCKSATATDRKFGTRAVSINTRRELMGVIWQVLIALIIYDAAKWLLRLLDHIVVAYRKPVSKDPVNQLSNPEVK